MLRIDASREGLGAVLCQEQEGLTRVISYASRGLKKSERNYCSNKLEFLALRWAVTHKFHDHLYGHHFKVTTDNNPLTYVLTTAKLDACGHRWLAELTTYDFELVYKSGRTNIDADILSRLPQTCTCSVQMVNELCSSVPDCNPWQGCVTSIAIDPHICNQVPALLTLEQLVDDWAKEQHEDGVLQNIIQAKKSSLDIKSLPNTLAYRLYRREWSNLKLRDGVLYYAKSDSDRGRLVLPGHWHDQTFNLVHDHMGHMGRD
jgi:hypothetical protein